MGEVYFRNIQGGELAVESKSCLGQQYSYGDESMFASSELRS